MVITWRCPIGKRELAPVAQVAVRVACVRQWDQGAGARRVQGVQAVFHAAELEISRARARVGAARHAL